MIIREGLALTLAGVAIGIPCALAAGRLIRAMLFDLTPSDPATMWAAALFFVLVGAIAGLPPARRASAVDPMVALRTE